MKENHSLNPNPALKSLEGLVGEWQMVLSNASFLPNSSATITGHVSFEWVAGGAFLLMAMGNQPRGTPDATWLISITRLQAVNKQPENFPASLHHSIAHVCVRG